MKKLIALSSFIVFGVMAFAQAPAKTNGTANNKEAVATTPVPVAQTSSEATVTVAEEKKAEKKECSSEEKKACGTKAQGKKSCCSSKAEAKKEENK